MSYTQSAILGVGTNYDGSKFSYPVKRYTKLFNSKFGRTLLEQDNTDRCVATRLYQADKDGNKVTLIREKIDGLGDISKTRYSSNGEKLSSLRFPKNGTGEVSLLEHIGKDVKIGHDVIIHPNVEILGKTEIGDFVEILPGSYLNNSKIENCAVVDSSKIVDSCISEGTIVGPMSYVSNNKIIK